MDGAAPEIQHGHNSPSLGPFGYSFLSPMDTPYEQAPALPPGPSLLDDNESNMLDTFFTTMNTNSLANDFWFRGQPRKSNFDWSEELPPTFQGSTTSLSQPAFQSHSLKQGLITTGGTGPEVYAAASMLYHGGMHSSNPRPTLAQQAVDGQPLHRVQAKRASQPAQASPSTPTRNRLPTGFHTSEMLFDVRDPIPADEHPSRKVHSLHWGSDISFMDRGYVAPPDQPDEEQRTRDLLDHLECFEPATSTGNTRAPSPERVAETHPARRGMSVDDAFYPRKRQRTLQDAEMVSDEDELSVKSRMPRNAKGRRGSTDPSRKGKVLPSNKVPRENLSEEQKRTNHILSEQKRRNLIRQGFDDLCSLVPGLRGGGFSKSAMLTQAADWLEDLLRGNEILQSQLADMKSTNGLIMHR